MESGRVQRLKLATRPVAFSLFLSFLFLIFILPGPTQAAPGDLDPSFGVGGIVTTVFSSYDVAADIAIQPDGKILVVGTDLVHFSQTIEYNVFALARYNPDGSLDNSFGIGGKVTTLIDGISATSPSLAIQSDGKILIGGSGIVIRYDTDGNRDPAFGTGGIVDTTSILGSFGTSIIALQSDGKIVEVGRGGYSPPFSITLLRLNPDGTLDVSFGSGGSANYNTNGFTFLDMTLQSDNKIVVGGGAFPFTATTTTTTTTTILGPTTTTTTIQTFNGRSSFGVLRYNPDGSIDNSFGTSGNITTDFSGYVLSAISAITIQSDGKIVAAGDATNCLMFTIYGNCYSYEGQFALARYNVDGSLDASFGTGGTIMTQFYSNPISTHPVVARSLAIQSDGKLVVVGYAYISNSMGPLFALARYNTDGTLDSTFGAGGKVTTSIFGGGSANAVVLQQDGNIVVAGDTIIGGTYDFALARYLSGLSSSSTTTTTTATTSTTTTSTTMTTTTTSTTTTTRPTTTTTTTTTLPGQTTTTTVTTTTTTMFTTTTSRPTTTTTITSTTTTTRPTTITTTTTIRGQTTTTTTTTSTTTTTTQENCNDKNKGNDKNKDKGHDKGKCNGHDKDQDKGKD